MAACGYVEPWSVAQAGSASIHLSSREAEPAVSIVALDDAALAGQDLVWPLAWAGQPLRVQQIAQGGWIEFLRPEGAPRALSSLELRVELLVTANATPRTLIAAQDVVVRLRHDRLLLAVAGEEVEADRPLWPHLWHRLSLEIEPDHVSLVVAGPSGTIALSCARGAAVDCRRILLGSDGAEREPTVNARYARPTLLVDGAAPVCWQFPPGPPVTALAPVSGQGWMLHFHNRPTFGMCSLRWRGDIHDPRLDASQYDAVHCHESDMEPLDWQPSRQLAIPEDAAPGIYALELRLASGRERIPFFVRASRPRAPIAFLVPSLTYLAYADEALPEAIFPWVCEDRGHRFAQQNGLLSLYDRHADGSGVSLTTTLRPKVTLRDDYRYPLSGSPHLLPVDLRLLRFCRAEGIAFDLLTDHDLHAEGAQALLPYRGIFTGSHPEYWTGAMQMALDEFLRAGRSLAYLGGNGLMWVSAIAEDAVEVRRGQGLGARTWDGKPGEGNLALTGELGGMWRERGRSEFSVIGSGMSMMGFSAGRPYRRLPVSYERAHDWIFEGVAADCFGAEGTVLGAAAGYEVDRRDAAQGTHPDTVALAIATGFDEAYQTDPNEFFATEAERCRARIAEMTVRRLPAGGFIFGAGSVAWCGALPEPRERNDIGRITANVLRGLAG
jgi:N,N-dimethylformamidase